MKFTIAALLVFIAVGVWWLESRFSAEVAVMVVGGLAGVASLVVGYVLSMANTKATLRAVEEFTHANAMTEKARQSSYRSQIGVEREHARAAREAFAQRAKLDVMDDRRVWQLAQQQAKMLTQQQQLSAEFDDWGATDDVSADSWRYVE